MSDIVSRRVHGLAVYERPPRLGAGGEPGERKPGPVSADLESPSGRVVFVHGSMDRAASFVKVGRRLDGVEVVRYDRAGYGRSIDVAARPMADQVEDLVVILGDRPAVLVGHSLGGVIALLAARDHPQLVSAVVAFEAPMPWVPWWPRTSAGATATATAAEAGPEAAAEAFLRMMIGDERWEKLPPTTKAARRAEGRALVAEMAEMRSGRVCYDPAELSVPVVAGRGTLSAAHHQAATERLATAAPHAELMTIEGAGHAAHSTHPDAFATLVHRALAGRMA